MLFVLFLSVAVMLRCVLCPIPTARTVQDACVLFVRAVLPPLFTFSVASRILVRAGICGYLARSPVTRLFALLGLSPGGGAALVVGLFAGFPTGAAILAELCERQEIDRQEAARLLPFCNNAGASFVVGTVGATLFGSVELGKALLLAQTATVLCAILAVKRAGTCQIPAGAGLRESMIRAVTSSVSESASSMAAVCGYIVVFSVLADLLCAPLEGFPLADALIRGVLELSGGLSALSLLDVSPPLACFLRGMILGFGGICTFLQVADRAAAQISPSSYFVGKIMSTLLCGIFSLLFELLRRLPFAPIADVGVFIVIFTIAGVKNKIFFKKSVEKQKGMLYNRYENHCP